MYIYIYNFRYIYIYIYITKITGPTTLLWGIPLKTVAGSDFIPLTLTI